ncbi:MULTISPECIES: hypothetical protein [Lysinibacillus]|uniref:hypothetical protein n=1 Tax=Lysinibacillus TaxID=400634 RepID=UPI000508BE06|nr:MULTISPECIES: hypothetical protein [Lysinibacillus]KGA84116.1 hypothetical protein KQ41_04825 [Lysinibacillus fusiformis]MCE4042900.1 hypothetical protein [Lysinibacillus fusiformis]MCT6818024.1 hypothetical protein [Lysinibacillus fusiformis]MCT6927785.1 hypothetical protein [Lysinibacillus fusiformis]MCT6932419.1 hypothetical protein [Lysinibacillus fusiformis]
MLKKPFFLSSALVLSISPLASTFTAQAAENNTDLTNEIPSTENFSQEENLTYLPLETYIHDNNGLQSFSVQPRATMTIQTGYYIKEQGYLTNKQLRDYVEYVDKQSNTLGWTFLITGFITLSKIAIAPAILMQFAGGAANFDIVKEQAYAGKGMGWAHMYADGPNTLSIIPRRDFSTLTIKYTK